MTPIARLVVVFSLTFLAEGRFRAFLWLKHEKHSDLSELIDLLELQKDVFCSSSCTDKTDCSSFVSAETNECLIMAGEDLQMYDVEETMFHISTLLNRRPNLLKRYEDSCDIRRECTTTNSSCIDGICQCQSGYSYDADTDVCLHKCNVYGRKFTLQEEGYCISYHNDRKIVNLASFDGCRSRCLAETEFTCKSFELYAGNCYLARISKLEVLPSEWKPWDECKYYQRNCD